MMIFFQIIILKKVLQTFVGIIIEVDGTGPELIEINIETKF